MVYTNNLSLEFAKVGEVLKAKKKSNREGRGKILTTSDSITDGEIN